jgi:hypothetical protein
LDTIRIQGRLETRASPLADPKADEGRGCRDRATVAALSVASPH